MFRFRTLVIVSVLVGSLIAAAVAMAEPPSNDNRDNAQVVQIPSTTAGTTVEATREQGEPFGECGSQGPTVWYRVDTPTAGRLNVSLQAQGELGAAVNVLRRTRTQITSVACDVTDESGHAETSVPVKAGESYLVRVTQAVASPAGNFELGVQFEAPTPRAPGAALPAGGASGRLHTVLNPAAAYSTSFREGQPYRINLDSGSDSEGGCQRLQVFNPGTRDFDEDQPRLTIRCEGYRVFTPGPGEGGRYSLVVRADREDSGNQPFRLQAAPAGRDDIAPGTFIRNYARKRGSVSAHSVDVVDLYRFDVTRTSELDLSLTTQAGADLQLLRASGRLVDCACDENGGRIRTQLKRGRYFAAVRARRGEGGRYTLRRVSRTITRTKITLGGRGRSSVRPGRTVPIAVRVSPAESGPVSILVYRFDPIEGWRFSQRFRRTARNGRAAAPLRLGEPGRWRAQAVFQGTRAASESTSGFAFITAQAPLQQRR